MTSIPTILYIGDTQVQGGDEAPITAAIGSGGASDLDAFLDLEMLRVTPDNATTGAPTAASLSSYPWYDGAAGATLYVIHSSPAPSATRIYATGTPAWTVNEWVGRYVTVIASTAGFQVRALVTANGVDYIDVAAWSATGDFPGGTPAAGLSFFLGQGRYTDYHPSAGWLTATEAGDPSRRGGSSWQVNDKGVGPDAGLMRLLFDEVYSTSPYFQLLKYYSATTVVGGWDTATGSAKAAFQLEWTRQTAAHAAVNPGGSQVWNHIVIDQSISDINNWSATPGGNTPANALLYQVALTQMIAYLRGASVCNNATATVHLINHDPLIQPQTTTGSTFPITARRIHDVIAGADANVQTVDLTGLRTQGARVSLWQPSENRRFYAPSEYWTDYAARLKDSIVRANDGTTVAHTGSIPVYLMIGDGIFVGEITETFVTELNSETLTGGTRPTQQKIWNATTGVAEAYNANDNSNTSGTAGSAPTNAGPEFSMMSDLQKIHPNGFVVIKRASTSSGLATTATAYSSGTGGRWEKGVSSEHYDALEALVTDAYHYCLHTLGKVPDLKGIYVSLGMGDAITSIAATGGTNFVNAVGTFVSDLRTSFATRTSGSGVPIVWRRPQLAVSGIGSDAMILIRNALDALAITDDQFVSMNVDDLGRDATDNSSETPRSAITDGRRMVSLAQTVAI